MADKNKISLQYYNKLYSELSMEEQKIIDGKFTYLEKENETIGEEKYPEIKKEWAPRTNEQLISEASGNLWQLCELARIEERKRLTEQHIQIRLNKISEMKNHTKTELEGHMLYSAEQELRLMGEFILGKKEEMI